MNIKIWDNKDDSHHKWFDHWQTFFGNYQYTDIKVSPIYLILKDENSPFCSWVKENNIQGYKLFFVQVKDANDDTENEVLLKEIIDNKCFLSFEDDNDALLFKMRWL